MEDLLCKRCIFLCQTEDVDQTDSVIEKLLLIEEGVPLKGRCWLCFGLLNISHLKEKLIVNKAKLQQYDHTAYKVITSFSCLFTLFHHYLKLKIAQMQAKTTIVYLDNIHTSTLRKCFKPLFSPFIKEIIGEAPLYEAEVGIYVSFNFTQEFYSYMSSFVSSLEPKQQYEITESDDISKIKTILNSILNPIIVKGFDNFFSWDKIDLDVTFQIKSEEFYIKGTYLKFNRELSQTKWMKEGVRLSATSVDEEIKKGLLHYYHFDSNEDCVISAGGREDRDVRMLGNGRPFIYKISNARKRYDIDYSKLCSVINDHSSLIQVKNISNCSKKEYVTLAKCTEAKLKRYMCVIWSEKEVNEAMMSTLKKMKNIKIIQKTPLRVIHKRVLTTREKEIIQLLPVKVINEHFFTLELLASAGTYIKEFVHSDMGRTVPSISSILKSECDILQLDVLDIILE